MMLLLCGMADRRKTLNLLSSCDHCLRFSRESDISKKDERPCLKCSERMTLQGTIRKQAYFYTYFQFLVDNFEALLNKTEDLLIFE